MKKFVVLATVLLLAMSVSAQFPHRSRTGTLVEMNSGIVLPSTWVHTMVAADTVAASKFRDTVYSPWVEIPYGCKFFWSVYADGKHALTYNGYKDSAFAKDSMNFNFQVSLTGFDGDTISTTNLGKLIPGSTDLDTFIQYAATLPLDTLMMRNYYVRTLTVIKDSAAATRPSVLGNTYSRSITYYLMARP